MNPTTRLSADERRHLIVDAVKRVFAEKGFDGTTTRDLAKAAGVSEALLYKHFPSKESLYDAMCEACVNGPGFIELKRILALKPSTSTLVVMIHFLISRFVQSRENDPGHLVMDRLMLRSILAEGDFARQALKPFAAIWIGKFEACMKAARKSGELHEIPVRMELRAWFAHHMAVVLMIHLHPQRPAVDYKVDRETLVEQAVWHVLLGVGIKPAAIKRHYNPKALLLMTP